MILGKILNHMAIKSYVWPDVIEKSNGFRGRASYNYRHLFSLENNQISQAQLDKDQIHADFNN